MRLATLLAALALAIPSTAFAGTNVNELENDGYGVCSASNAGQTFTLPSGDLYRCSWNGSYWTYQRIA